ncbi:MAG: type II toxin-antitoxin system HicB family antitoxin [Rhodobacteraceae bacterium]|nr:type II toxin-antitoxin system HicB family antitoxin [Paracoccaceae bacterium]
MTHYFAVIDKEEDSAFGVWFPDVKGCFSASDNPDNILKNAIEALSLHLEGMEAPQSRSIDEVRSDPEVARHIAGGAYLLSVPHVARDQRLVRANLSVPKGVLDAIDAEADRRGLTRSAFLTEVAMNAIIKA